MALKRTFLVVMLTFTLVNAQQEGSLTTGDLMNGRAWQSLAPAERAFYTLGIKDGIFLLSSTIGDKGRLRQTNVATKSTIDDYVKELNALYNSPQNLNIPVVAAFQHVTRRLKGEMTTEELDSNLTDLRKAFSK